MNVILLEPHDYLSEENGFNDSRVRLSDERAQHIREILGAEKDKTLKVGNLSGLLGSADVLRIDEDCVELRVTCDREPPPKLPLTIILALPRPKMLRRILRTVAELGVRELILINSAKVEKSYWQTPALNPETVRDYFIDGLQQSGDTVLPSIHFEKLFKPFVEDRLPALLKNSHGIVAHPGTNDACPIAFNQDCVLAIGPEGGFTPYEVEKLSAAGMHAVHLGTRILRVENALTTLIARLYS
ncbi:MAG: 16S rRNA (uracil(1498)-N(3))-methyltransferase [Spongiibacteraceae bacterium]